MWNGVKVANWIISLKFHDILLAFKISVGAACIFYGLSFGYLFAVLFLVLCLIAFKLPVIVIYFDQLFLNAEISNPPQKQQLSHVTSKPSTPYFLIEDGPISSEVNEALETFLNGIIDKFIISWHSTLRVKEDEFIIECRHILKYMTVRLYQLFHMIDFPDLIVEKVIPIFLWHMSCYATGLERRHYMPVEKFVLQSFGANIHPAIASRDAEEAYLRHCSEQILKELIPPQLKSSKLLSLFLRDILSCQILQHAMDALANPEHVNRLLVLWLDENNAVLGNSSSESDPGVPILKNFIDQRPPNTKEMLLYPSLPSILKTPPHLYHFMQFLKRISTLKYLQFCFAVDEFNEKLLNPDLTLVQMEKLRIMGQKMHEIYFCDSSPDCIGFEPESRVQMEEIVYANATEIVRLRTSSTLFRAYDYVMDILEHKILPRFYRSPEFYQLVTGANQNIISSEDTKKKGEVSSTGWRKKLRAALRPSWLGTDTKSASSSVLDMEDESSLDTGVDLTEADFIADDPDIEAGAYANLIPVSGRDLSAWKVCIPRVVSALDSANKPICAFEIEIQREDIRPEDDPEEYHWTVIRTYLEFFHLESKLLEFHGDLIEIRLPSKKMFGTKDMKFLESVRPEFEAFLRMLLQQPAFKGSDLIFSFLTLSDLSVCQAVGENSAISSNLLPDLGFSRLMRHVPMKLRKERGQDLESFLQTFIASTESPKPKPSKTDVRDLPSSEVSVPMVVELHPLYKENAKTFLPQGNSSSRDVRSPAVHFPKLRGPYDGLLYAAWKIWKIPKLLLSVLMGLRSLLSVYVDFYVRKFVRVKFKNLLQPGKISLAIKLLDEAVLQSSENKLEETDYKHKAWSLILKNIPDRMKTVFGDHSIEERCELMFQCLQYPVLNKHLSYMLLDVILNEVFPEMFSKDAATVSC